MISFWISNTLTRKNYDFCFIKQKESEYEDSQYDLNPEKETLPESIRHMKIFIRLISRP